MNSIQPWSRSTDWHYLLSNTWMESKSPSLLSLDHQLRHLVAVIAKSQNMSYPNCIDKHNAPWNILPAKKLSLSLSLHGPGVCYEYISNKHIMKPISPGLWCLNPHEISFLPFHSAIQTSAFQVYKTLTSVASNPWKMISEAIPLSTLGKEEWNATWTFFSTEKFQPQNSNRKSPGKATHLKTGIKASTNKAHTNFNKLHLKTSMMQLSLKVAQRCTMEIHGNSTGSSLFGGALLQGSNSRV